MAMASDFAIPPPLPLLPIPSARQLLFQAREQAMFFHFGMNTFTNSEWGTGKSDPKLFNPSKLDARQWVRVAKEAGFKMVILTAKHHDGFCLWPSAYTNYSVASSNWRNGTGDVVGDLVKAAENEGLKVGLYLSPWDRHERSYGEIIQYNEFYLGQMQELLTRYGSVSEVWLDGAKGENQPAMTYMFNRWFNVVHQLQPTANIFSDAGPDVRWVGNEGGEAGSTCWSMVNSSSIKIGHCDQQYLNTGDQHGLDWVPPECDVSIRPGWFWHSAERPKTAETLVDIYFKSVGRNCLLLLNVPPNSSGLLAEEDIKVLRQFKSTIDLIFLDNLAANASVRASSTRSNTSFKPSNILSDDDSTFWAPEDGQTSGYLEMTLPFPTDFNLAKIQEPIRLGQRIVEYSLKVWEQGSWLTISKGTTVGYKKLDLFSVVKAQVIRLVIEKARAEPLIASFGLYLDTSSTLPMSIKTKY
ncbi:hypothetical protein O6H91_08G078800 [Diphasiastrum complanatum]|uniref:Uncharacterized protein n=1 Tax=Diphasiastrum complanatum TaxID=34168 RepID=A0ACC2CZ75_DIPCM|nr:hypothetical protein O6H91_08G078800 [Diphasiastrum complanatum]